MRFFVFLLFSVAFIGLFFISITGCNTTTATNFVAALDKAEQIYKAQRELYMEMRDIVIHSNIDKETKAKLAKADEAMRKADARLQELWNNEAIRRGQNIHRAIEISDNALALVKTAIKLLK